MENMEVEMLKNFYKGKKVVVTGHTGFKGGWLCMILHQLGCEISGLALNPSGKNNFFKSVNLGRILKYDFRQNIGDLKKLEKSSI